MRTASGRVRSRRAVQRQACAALVLCFVAVVALRVSAAASAAAVTASAAASPSARAGCAVAAYTELTVGRAQTVSVARGALGAQSFQFCAASAADSCTLVAWVTAGASTMPDVNLTLSLDSTRPAFEGDLGVGRGAVEAFVVHDGSVDPRVDLYAQVFWSPVLLGSDDQPVGDDAQQVSIVVQCAAQHSPITAPFLSTDVITGVALNDSCAHVQLDGTSTSSAVAVLVNVLPVGTNGTFPVGVVVYGTADTPYPNAINSTLVLLTDNLGAASALFNVARCDEPFFLSVCAVVNGSSPFTLGDVRRFVSSAPPAAPTIFTMQMVQDVILWYGGDDAVLEACQDSPLVLEVQIQDQHDTLVMAALHGGLADLEPTASVMIYGKPDGLPLPNNATWVSLPVPNSTAAILTLYNTDSRVTPPSASMSVYLADAGIDKAEVEFSVQVPDSPQEIDINQRETFVSDSLQHNFFSVQLDEEIPAHLLIEARVPVQSSDGRGVDFVGEASAPLVYMATAVRNLFPTVVRADLVRVSRESVVVQYIQDTQDCAVFSVNVAVLTLVTTGMELMASTVPTWAQFNVSNAYQLCASGHRYISLNMTTGQSASGWNIMTNVSSVRILASDLRERPTENNNTVAGFGSVQFPHDAPQIYVSLTANATIPVSLRFWPIPACPYSCNGHGSCQLGECVCDDGYDPPYCRYVSGHALIVTVAVTCSFAVAAGIVIVVFCVWRRRRQDQSSERKPLISRTGVAVNVMGADWRISYGELSLTRRIGAGNYGEGACVPPPVYCIVTEYVARGSLAVLLSDSTQAIDWPRMLSMTRDIARGMSYLHDLGIVHRDLKPANLLVDDHWNIKIADFGLARAKRASGTMTHVGTPQYAAPEVLRHERYGTEADVYSFGIIFWEMLTRRTPYADMHAVAAGMAVAFKSLRPPIPPTCPPMLVELMVKCWDPIAANRPTFSEVLSVLDSFAPPRDSSSVQLPLAVADSVPVRWNRSDVSNAAAAASSPTAAHSHPRAGTPGGAPTASLVTGAAASVARSSTSGTPPVRAQGSSVASSSLQTRFGIPGRAAGSPTLTRRDDSSSSSEGDERDVAASASRPRGGQGSPAGLQPQPQPVAPRSQAQRAGTYSRPSADRAPGAGEYASESGEDGDGDSDGDDRGYGAGSSSSDGRRRLRARGATDNV